MVSPPGTWIANKIVQFHEAGKDYTDTQINQLRNEITGVDGNENDLPIITSNLTVTGNAVLNSLNVTGNSSLNTLNVIGNLSSR